MKIFETTKVLFSKVATWLLEPINKTPYTERERETPLSVEGNVIRGMRH